MIKIGELAQATGLSIRTLHYYEEIGLLTPSGRTQGGHRFYAREDVARLQQMVSLKQVGFSLEQIRMCLDETRFSPKEVLQMQLTRIQTEIQRQHQLADRLRVLICQFDAGELVAIEDFFQIIKFTTMYEKYYTPKQLETLRNRAEAMGESGMQKAQQDWMDLIAEAQQAMQANLPHTHPDVVCVAQRWKAMIRLFTGGDPAMMQSLKNLYQQEGAQTASRNLVDPALMAYLAPALEVATDELD